MVRSMQPEMLLPLAVGVYLPKTDVQLCGIGQNRSDFSAGVIEELM